MLAHFARIASALGFCLLFNAPAHAQAIPPPTAGADAHDSARELAGMRQAVAEASGRGRGMRWSGPPPGPPARPGATVAIVSEDLRNGGILGVVKGIQEAAGTIKWNLKIYNAGGTAAGRSKALAAALALKPDGVILTGVDAKDIEAQLQPLAARGTPIVGWHVGPFAGPMVDGPVAVNVSSDPLEVARIAAMAAVVQSEGRAGVVIFTDNHFAIARAKANAMAEVIRACRDCALLEIRDVPISKTAELMPAVTQDLLTRYGTRWTHALAINDIYFDYAAPELTKAGRPSKSLSMLSAGDGSAAAFLRIRAGTFQTGTVAEPLNLQGWQLVDELNRLLAQRPPTANPTPVHLVTPGNVAFDGGAQLRYDPDNGYRDMYRRIWQR
jgi:ribose transport system substrate-binding protein